MKFSHFAWLTLIYNLFVILWGAFVRATGSGAGCGSHWPTCNGEVIPRAPQIETIIEFTHRATSGLALILVLILLIWAFRAYPKGHLVRRGAVLSAVFMLIEALLGAGLVLFELVAHNPSLTRAFSMALHLANTFLLISALSLTAWWASGGTPPPNLRAISPKTRALWGFGFLIVLLLGMTGAITALGDTLFPAQNLLQGLEQKFEPGAHFAVRMRLFHPLIAFAALAYLFILIAPALPPHNPPAQRKLALALLGLFFTQLLAGAINVALLAPVWMQLVHLLLADLIWIALTLLANDYLSDKV